MVQRLYSTMKRLYLLAFLLAACAGVAFSQTNWTATAGPFGGNIDRLKKAPNGDTYAVVSQRLYRSTNNGDTWTQVVPTSPTSLFLNDIMIDTDGKLYAAYWSQLFRSADNGATWTTIANNLFQSALHINRVGPDNVFVVWGSSGVFVSIDKGLAWTQISNQGSSGTPGLWANTAGDIFYAVQGGGLLRHAYAGLTANWSAANTTQIFTVAPSTVNAMAFGSTGKIFLSAFDKIYTSTNTAPPYTFTDITTSSGLAPNYTYFYGPMGVSPDGSVQIFNTSYSKVHKSTDQGASWATTDSPSLGFGTYETYPPVFISASTYLLPTGGEVLKTTNTGTTWASVSTGITGATTESVVVVNTTGRIIATKYGRGYFSSTNGGSTWAFSPLTNYVRNVKKLSDGTLILYGGGVFYRSTDNGTNFTTDNVYYYDNFTVLEASNGDLYAFYKFWDGVSAFVPKFGKSTNKGATWTELTVAGLPTESNSSFSYAAIDASNNIMMHGYDGTAWKTYKLVNLATTPTATVVTLPNASSLNNIFFLDGKFYATQFSSYYVTSDLGTTWTTVGFSGNKVFPLKNASYSGVAVSRPGGLYVSQNDGGSWAIPCCPLLLLT